MASLNILGEQQSSTPLIIDAYTNFHDKNDEEKIK